MQIFVKFPFFDQFSSACMCLLGAHTARPFWGLTSLGLSYNILKYQHVTPKTRKVMLCLKYVAEILTTFFKFMKALFSKNFNFFSKKTLFSFQCSLCLFGPKGRFCLLNFTSQNIGEIEKYFKIPL